MKLNPMTSVRAALDTIRANPGVVEAIDAEAQATAAAEAAETKRLAEARAKVDKDMPARILELVADWHALEEEAIRAAAESLAREQLERRHGLVSLRVAAMYPASPRLSRDRVDRAILKLIASAPVPWDRQGRPAARLRADEAGEAAAALERPAIDARMAEARARADAIALREADRQAAHEARKAGRMAALDASKRAAGMKP